ncbi:hypothetical protein B0T14DRAFT_486803 [Immersiella caudata]|uniref:Uncharacterized protein n=1 Tax=Immersiella caudata TaxID=314043 RepID=A0AA40BUW0_9PEZI|nr:hypothetical protein B0T14DRAFT_486803 [Immersiella caudata]
MTPLSRLLLQAALLLSAALVTATPSSKLPTRQNTVAETPPRADCALVDCADRHKCVIINNIANCIPNDEKPDARPLCGKTRCPLGQECCNPSCGICTPPGRGCIKLLCRDDPPPKEEPPKRVECGHNLCAAGEICCNESCGYCRKPGELCTEEFCLTGPQCGPNRCPRGETCCNESCGYCTGPGARCTKEACLGPKCGDVFCKVGEKCCDAYCGMCAKDGMGCGGGCARPPN